MISTNAVSAAMEMSSQRPARVSTILRNSTVTSRLKGTRGVRLTSSVMGAEEVVTAGLLSGRARG